MLPHMQAGVKSDLRSADKSAESQALLEGVAPYELMRGAKPSEQNEKPKSQTTVAEMVDAHGAVATVAVNHSPPQDGKADHVC